MYLDNSQDDGDDSSNNAHCPQIVLQQFQAALQTQNIVAIGQQCDSTTTVLRLL